MRQVVYSVNHYRGVVLVGEPFAGPGQIQPAEPLPDPPIGGPDGLQV